MTAASAVLLRPARRFFPAPVQRAGFAAAVLPAHVFPASAFEDDCRDRLQLAVGGGFIKRCRPVTDGLEVVVAEETWNSVGVAAKEGTARPLTCALLDDGEVFTRILFRGDRTDKVIGEAREDGFKAP